MVINSSNRNSGSKLSLLSKVIPPGVFHIRLLSDELPVEEAHLSVAHAKSEARAIVCRESSCFPALEEYKAESKTDGRTLEGSSTDVIEEGGRLARRQFYTAHQICD